MGGGVVIEHFCPCFNISGSDITFFEALSLELAVISFAPFAKTYIDIMELKPLSKNTEVNKFKTESAAK